MKLKTIFISIITGIAMSFTLITCPAFSEEPRSESDLEKNKTEIIRSIEKFEHSLKVAKGCVSEAETETEMEKCRENIKIREFQEVQEKLSEIGLTWEERRIKRILPEK